MKEADSAVKIRENAATYHPRGCRRRRDEIRRYHSLGYNRWKEKTGYGRRWAIEGFFSAMKRKFGEDSTARSLKRSPQSGAEGLGIRRDGLLR
ncbi:MAG: transposase [Thermoprotei archaeon]